MKEKERERRLGVGKELRGGGRGIVKGWGRKESLKGREERERRIKDTKEKEEEQESVRGKKEESEKS